MTGRGAARAGAADPPDLLHIHIDGASRGNPGEAGFGTYVVIDYNGSAPDTVHDMGNIMVFDLQGVAENQLGFTTFASHFFV